MSLRLQAIAEVNNLRSREKAEQTAVIQQIDTSLSENAQVTAIIKEQIMNKVNLATAAFDEFADESKLNKQAYDSAIELTNNAKTEYANRKSMIGSSDQALIENQFVELDYKINYNKALMWVINYEQTINSIDLNSQTIGEAIADAKALKASYENSAEKAIIEVLNQSDKDALTNRINGTNEALNSLEEQSLAMVKEVYVVNFEEAVKGDLTNYGNIENAFQVLEYLNDNITLTEEDGAQFTRYNTAIETLYTALETYLKNAISEVSNSLNAEFKTLESFVAVRNKYNNIVLNLLDEDCAGYQEVMEVYNQLKAKIEANMWYNFSQTSLSNVEQNSTGIYFDMTPQFPARINYNKKLNLSTGVNISLECTGTAFYNGDKDEAGNNKGANLFCFNFLNNPNSYKSMSDGLSVVIWLFEVESSVNVVNSKDENVVIGTISTPIDGGKLNINLRHGMYEDFAAGESYKAYVLTVNGVEIVVSDEIASANGINVNDECYFSFGSFADYKKDPNCFTLINVNDDKFAKVEETTDPVDPVDPTDPTDSTDDPKPTKKGGCFSTMSYSLLPAFACSMILALVIVTKKRKEN